MTVLVNLENVTKSYGSNPLFQDLSLGIFTSDKIGLIGPNGSGKSTLLKIIAKRDAPDQGNIAMRRELRIGYVPQQQTYPDQTLFEILMNSLQEMHLDEHEKELRIHILLSKMGFSDPHLSIQRLSGGWKKRLDIAIELIKEPDVLLLDEPTNHLDLESILWLEQFLPSQLSTYVVISHDRYFLQNVSNRIVEINTRFPKGVFSANGTYDEFLEKRTEFLKGQEEYSKSLNSKVRFENEWLKQNPKARTTKSFSRIQQAERLQKELAEVQQRNVERKSQFGFSATERLTRKLIVGKNLGKTLGEKALFAHLDFTLSPGMRVGIAGKNGTGKSTLLKILAGQMTPDFGTLKLADGIQIAYYDQHREQLPLDVSLRRALAPYNDMIDYRGQQIHVNSWCKRFLFPQEKLDLPLSQFSGGERARVLIARFMSKPADVLLLDEPTNDLDIPTLEVLEESLTDFPGAIVLITHDRFLQDRVCNHIIGLGADQQYHFADYSQWNSHLEQFNRLPTKKAAEREETKAKESTADKKQKMTYKDKRELELIEPTLNKIEEQIHEIQAQIESHPSDMSKLQALSLQLQQLEQKRDQLYERWQELESLNGS